jgi:hypothetical protein
MEDDEISAVCRVTTATAHGMFLFLTPLQYVFPLAVYRLKHFIFKSLVVSSRIALFNIK